MDELWSFVDNKGNKQWVWLAIEAETREIVGCYIGDRSGDSAQKLWQSLHAVYRQCAVIYTDFCLSYPVALPSKRHRVVGKETGKTNYIERLNCTLRQRVSRLVSVSHLLEGSMGMNRKIVSIDKQTDDNIVHQNGFRKANSLSS